jgi:uncharacterized protein (DUF983 family)
MGEAMPSLPEERPFLAALPHAMAGRCPACGLAPLFGRFLKPVDHCRACGQDWSHQQADDFPAYIVILLLGHVLVPMVISVNLAFSPSLVGQMVLWPTLTAILALLMIQPVKGGVIAWQWARRMHGF